ncbi:hypothetical protein [Streptomyces sp. NPDC052127]|uniref:hypothetical protein n=1 Tax=Streptomyces sp. NPDC052127 TaxID=3155679 RepID=UPI00343F2F8D
MNDRSAAPGSLALVESLVNTLDLESGADALDTAEGRARFGLPENPANPANPEKPENPDNPESVDAARDAARPSGFAEA